MNFDSRKNVIVIEGEALKQFPSLNLSQLIGFISNMNFINRGLFQADPQVQGFNQEQFALMVNGMYVNNSQTGHHNFLLPFDIEQIERIEVLKGGHSSFFKSSGAGGIINIITTKKDKTLKIQKSSFDTYKASLNLNLKYFSFSSGIQSTDGYTEGIDGKKYFIQAGLQIPFKKSYVDFWSGWTLSKFGAYNFYAPYPSFEELEKILGILKWNTELKKNTSLLFKVSSQYSNDQFNLYRENPDIYSNHHKTLQNSIEARIKNTGRSFNSFFGISAFSDSITSNGIRNAQESEALGIHNRNFFSIFGEVNGDKKGYFFSSGLRMTLGSQNHLSGHFLAGKFLRKNLKISSSVNRSIRIPTYTELYYNDPAHSSNEGLIPESTWGYDISLEYSLNSYNLSTRLFLNHSKNLIDWVRDEDENLWESKNIKKGDYYGIDLELSSISEKSMIQFLYTFQKTNFDNNPFLKSLKYHYYFPEHSLSLVYMKKVKFLSFYSALKIENELEGRKIRYYLNVKIWKEMGKATFFFEVLNVFNHRTEKIPGLLEPPRSYGAGLIYKFDS